MSTYVCLDGLLPKKKQPSIRVKIVRKWQKPIGSIRSNTCLIFGDEKGATIEATLPSDVILPFAINLNEGDWFEINDFKLMHAFEQIRTTKNKYRISITQETLFSRIHPITECSFLCCASYKEILRGLTHPKFSVDLCGAMVQLGDIEDIESTPGNPNFADNLLPIRFSMIDTNLTQVRCVAYGYVAEKLYHYVSASNAYLFICVLKLWRIERVNGRFRHLTTIEGCSDILFDPQISEIKDFRTMWVFSDWIPFHE